MHFIFDSFWQAMSLIWRMDRDLFDALFITMRVSLSSTAIASILALPFSFCLAKFNFLGKGFVLAILRTALAFPAVVVGVMVYSMLARQGPLGHWQLLFTPTAIIIGQVVLILPLMTALFHTTLQENIHSIYEEAVLLGASPLQAVCKALSETHIGILTALFVGFGRVLSEVGVSLILGGNIRGLTRTVTTAITLETNQGYFARAVALGIVLLALVLLLNLLLHLAGRRSAK
jgi:tungstate transport system permease protein